MPGLKQSQSGGLSSVPRLPLLTRTTSRGGGDLDRNHAATSIKKYMPGFQLTLKPLSKPYRRFDPVLHNGLKMEQRGEAGFEGQVVSLAADPLLIDV